MHSRQFHHKLKRRPQCSSRLIYLDNAAVLDLQGIGTALAVSDVGVHLEEFSNDASIVVPSTDAHQNVTVLSVCHKMVRRITQSNFRYQCLTLIIRLEASVGMTSPPISLRGRVTATVNINLLLVTTWEHGTKSILMPPYIAASLV